MIIIIVEVFEHRLDIEQGVICLFDVISILRTILLQQLSYATEFFALILLKPGEIANKWDAGESMYTYIVCHVVKPVLLSSQTILKCLL